MQSFLRRQLILARDTCLSALSQGPAALETFSKSWSSLHTTVTEAIAQDQVDEETIILTHDTANLVEILASGFLELYTEAEDASLSLQNDLDDIFSELSITESHLSQPPIPSESPGDNASKTTSTSTLAPYIQLSYQWLLENIHNPYPSKDFRLNIVNQTGCNPKDVDNWFINARKRIGWNALRIKHFENRRSLIVRAATNFFKRVPQKLAPNEKFSADSLSDYDIEFVAIENNVNELYANKLFKSDLVDKVIVNESQPEATAENLKVSSPKDQVSLWNPAAAYPSPRYSPEPLFSGASPPVESITSPLSRKRRMSSEASDKDLDSESLRSAKRTRLQEVAASLPSPAASMIDCVEEQPPRIEKPAQSSPAVVVSINQSLSINGKRKRRLSDSEPCVPSKRQHTALSIPRLQTVSNPLPAPHIFSSYWPEEFVSLNASHQEFPSLVTETLDDGSPVEIQLYDYALQSFVSLSNNNTACEYLQVGESIVDNPTAHVMCPIGPSVLDYAVTPSDLNLGLDLPDFPAVQDFSWLEGDTMLSDNQSDFAAALEQFTDADLWNIQIPSLPLPSDLGCSQPQTYLFNQPNPAGSSSDLLFADDKSAKSERLQLLREELRRLEAEIS